MKTNWRNCFLTLLAATSLTACSGDAFTTGPMAQNLTSTERLVPLSGQPNMRDLGGYTNKDGKIVKTGKIYRSGDLSALTTDDLSRLNGMFIKRVFDFRTASEISSKADQKINNATVSQLSLLDEQSLDPTAVQKVMSGQITGEQYMLPLYTIDDTKIQVWKTFFSAIQTNDNITVYHCTAGKDRAGMTSALILSALDVPRQTIINDFMLSNTYLASSIKTQSAGMDTAYGAGTGDKMRPILGVEQQYIEAMFSDIETKYGSVDNFLTVLGVDKNKMKKLYLF